MSNDLFSIEDEEQEDFSEFRPQPEVGDLKALNDLIQRTAEVKAGLEKLGARTEEGKALYKNLTEVELPQKLKACGFKPGDTISYGGIKVELKSDNYANIPSLSAIEGEKDEQRKAEIIARREKGLEILEEKAPTLIKRKYEIIIDRERLDQVESVRNLLECMEDPPEWNEGKSVHPATLGKWISERKKGGDNLSEDENWAFGVFPRDVAKITK